ncbi:transporter [Saccharopolyspora gloriosae]|uniref:PH-like domain-containing protein n=1 Tax=Saccharopolyspora gloriosae TaxID=455344 RepID=UPI001FB76A49|nr:transporter [Saccharopolyspora gloriosae]
MERTLWVLALLLLLALVYFGMRRGWLNRKRRQTAELAEFPVAPEGVAERPELLADASGFYVGSTRAEDWQDRIAVGDIGHRANAVARLRAEGLLLERTGASPLWIPAESVVDARVDHKLANKVVPGAGMLVVTWRLGDQDIDTGFRADDKSAQDEWAGAVRALAPAAGRDDMEGQA